ncbi:hypothetical protein C0993_010356 [Termitomyces sp. T159_Od127]|nr:hypothetical protein C0993_010356 [Termitomyces sp. T159_Od127]
MEGYVTHHCWDSAILSADIVKVGIVPSRWEWEPRYCFLSNHGTSNVYNVVKSFVGDRFIPLLTSQVELFFEEHLMEAMVIVAENKDYIRLKAFGNFGGSSCYREDIVNNNIAGYIVKGMNNIQQGAKV